MDAVHDRLRDSHQARRPAARRTRTWQAFCNMYARKITTQTAVTACGSRKPCGHELIDLWLRSSALQSERMGTARTRVWADAAGSVLAYFSLAPHLVTRSDVDFRVGRGSPQSIPSILLAKLALDRHGHGEGRALLVDALTLAIEGMRNLGGRLIVVDAIDEDAAGFYRKHGFIACPGRSDRG